MDVPALGRRSLLVYLAFLFSLGGVAPDDFEFRTGSVEAVAVEHVDGALRSPDSVDHDHDAISDVGPFQEVLRLAHESGDDGVARATLEVEDERSFYAVSNAYLELPQRCRARSVRGAYVDYRGETYVLRVNSGVL